MKPENILKADILDILFENRNKDYGAYELRTHYASRLKKSMMITFLFLLVLIMTYYWLGTQTKQKTSPVFDPEVHFTEVTFSSKEIMKLKPLPARARRPAPTIMNVVPLIVKTNIDDTNPPPTIEELAQNQIGIETKAGDNVNTNDQPGESNQPGDSHTNAQPEVDKEMILETSEVMPEFPGGIAALQRFLHRNLRMPKEDIDPGSSYRVKLRFVVDKDGTVIGISLMQSAGEDFDEEVIRVVKKMPKWKPGMQHGNNVAVYYYLPVIFEVPQENP